MGDINIYINMLAKERIFLLLICAYAIVFLTYCALKQSIQNQCLQPNVTVSSPGILSQ